MRRSRLLDRLTAGADGPLTLLAAPAGAGKSALVSAWAAERASEPVAWLSLDAIDGDRRRFWRAVLEALRRAGVGRPVATLELHPSQAVDPLLAAFINGLDQLDAPIVLVLDDLQEIDGSPALEDLDRLLRHPPPTLRLIASSRVDPALRLGRLRLGGQLCEIRAADLAFTRQETAALLHASGVEVGSDVVEQLWERTEGWAAGVRLAALALRTHADPAAFVAEFAGDDATVADYLVGEVLAQQPPELRDFLLRISILDAVNGDLADALTGRHDSGRVLDRLRRDHALLTSTGGARAWHRLHPLFVELLRSELQFSASEEIPDLHRTAAGWFDRHGHPAQALQHAAAAEDWPLAGALAGEHWLPLLLDGELQLLRPVLDGLPGAQPDADPELALAIAAAHADVEDEHGARSWLDTAHRLRNLVPPERRRRFDTSAAVVALLLARAGGDVDAAEVHAATLLDPRAEAESGARAAGLRALALTQLGITRLWSGRLHDARRDLESARGSALAADREWLVAVCLAYLGTDAVMATSYERATALCDEAGVIAERRGWTHTWPMGLVAGNRGTMAFHRNRIDEASRHHERAAALLGAVGHRPIRAGVALQRARIAFASAQREAALEALEEAQAWLRDWPVMPAVLGTVTALQATIVAARGDREQADTLLASGVSAATPEGAVARARLHMTEGEAEEALADLEDVLHAVAMPFDRTRAEAWVVAAVAEEARAHHAAAGDALERALDHAERGGLHRPFLEHGASIGSLLRRHKRNGTRHRALLDELVAALEQPAAARSPAVLAEALSDREAAVLRFLPTMLSNQEIASELFVSVNTVKTHLKAIYRKLDVDDRRSAVRRGRESGLLGPQ